MSRMQTRDNEIQDIIRLLEEGKPLPKQFNQHYRLIDMRHSHLFCDEIGMFLIFFR